MASTPFFGPFDVTRSTNFADNQCINLRPAVTELKDGRGVGVLYGTPGLDLLATVGNGPINGERALGSLLYVVSALDVYTVDATWTAMRVGAISGNGDRVCMIDNGSQIAIFSNAGGWVGPIGFPFMSATISATGQPLTGGTISAAGVNHAIGDTIVLFNIDGIAVTNAIIQVLGTDTSGGVTSFSVFQGGVYKSGVFTPLPTNFTQLSTSGVGSGFTLTAPTFGAMITGGINYAPGDTVVMTPIGGVSSAALIITVTSVAAGSVTGFGVVQSGAFQTAPTGFQQQSTTGSGSGLELQAPTFGTTQRLCQIALPFVPDGSQAISAAFQDGFALCDEPGKMTLWQSTVLDISVWPALNFATADGDSDNVMSLAAIHRLIFVVKQRTTEVWVDAGTSGFAFQPISSVLIEHGTVAWGTVVRVDEGLLFLSRSSSGEGIVRELDGFTPRRISTHAIETLIASVAITSDAFGYSYQQEGHQFYVLTLPSGNLTLVYDHTESRLLGAPVWYQWLTFAAGAFHRHWGNAYYFFNGTPVLGDYRNGNLYRINLSTQTDDGQARKWQRSWRALPQAVYQPMRFSSLQIDMQTGVSVPDGTNPQVVLEWSDDGGNNWSAERFLAAGEPGKTATRVKFNRLGSTRRNAGLDRIFRLSSTDVFPVALLNAELDV